MASDHERRSSKPTNLYSYLDLIGEYLLIEIIKKLPVETLGRCRCVCKPWISLISSPYFINLQHRYTTSTIPPNLKPCLRLNSDYETEVGDFSQLALYRCPQQTLITTQLQFPFRFLDDSPTHSFRFTNSVNGVICISYSVGSGFDSTILWNPAIHKYLLLPRLPCALNLDIQSLMFGFGYSKSSVNEFKVVRIWLPYDYYIASSATSKSLKPTCEVYSTLEGVWRSLPSTLNDVLQSYQWEAMTSRKSCFVNGAIHWLIIKRADIANTGPDYLILTFECEQEAFTTMELPRVTKHNFNQTTRSAPIILEFGGKLAAVYLSELELSRKEWLIEMWVMQEHGVVSSWEKLHRVGDTFTSDGLVVSSYLTASREPDRERHYRNMEDHVHEESLFLLDHHNARSYTHDEMVNILIPEEFKRLPNSIYTLCAMWKTRVFR